MLDVCVRETDNLENGKLHDARTLFLKLEKEFLFFLIIITMTRYMNNFGPSCNELFETLPIDGRLDDFDLFACFSEDSYQLLVLQLYRKFIRASGSINFFILLVKIFFYQRCTIEKYKV